MFELRLITILLLLTAPAAAWTGCSWDGRESEDIMDTDEDEGPVEEDGGVDVRDETGDLIPTPDADPGNCLGPCTSDEDCENDDIFCNGRVTCDLEMQCCILGPACDTHSDACMEYTCIEELARCVETSLDSDRDGHAAMTAGGGPCEGGTDCDDQAYAVHPGARETCDSLDNDCDFVLDEDAWSMDGDPLVIPGSGLVLDAALMPAGDDWIVAWTEDGSSGSNVYAGLFDADTGALSPALIDDTGGAREIEIVDDGGGAALIVWTDSSGNVGARKIRFDPGLRQDPAVTLAGPALLGPEVSDLEAAAAPDGSRGAVFLRGQMDGNPEIYMLGISLDPVGLLPGDQPLRISQAIGFSGFPAAAAGENVIVVAWEDERDGNKEIYSATISLTDGEPSRELRLTAAPGDSQRPSVSATSGGFRVVWMDESEGPFNVTASTLDTYGQPQGYPVAMSGETQARYYPFASPDPRGTEGLDQHLIVYSSGQEHDLRLTAVGPLSVEIQEGLLVYSSPSLKIAGPMISRGQHSRGLLWIEHSYSESRLLFSMIRCL
jgi:hypothetical protein